MTGMLRSFFCGIFHTKKEIPAYLFFHAAEKIRTPDTLVRSQVLYPAELLPHIIQRKIILQLFGNCKSFSDLFQNLSFSTRLARIPYSGHFGKPFFHILQLNFQKELPCPIPGPGPQGVVGHIVKFKQPPFENELQKLDKK